MQGQCAIKANLRNVYENNNWFMIFIIFEGVDKVYRDVSVWYQIMILVPVSLHVWMRTGIAFENVAVRGHWNYLIFKVGVSTSFTSRAHVSHI